MRGLVDARPQRPARGVRVTGSNLNLSGRRQFGLTPDQIDPILLQQEAYPLRKLPADLDRPRNQTDGVDHRRQGFQSEPFGVVCGVQYIGTFQHHLGRNAAPVQADATQMRTLDQADAEAQLSRPDRGDISPRASAKDQNVIRCRQGLTRGADGAADQRHHKIRGLDLRQMAYSGQTVQGCLRWRGSGNLGGGQNRIVAPHNDCAGAEKGA